MSSSNYRSPPFQPGPDPYAHLPVNKPFLTFIILGILVLVWIATEFAGGSQNDRVLITFGANFGRLIIAGETWRLFTAMFLHIGLDHLIANAFGLLIFGLEMERLYGQARFILVYLLSGLFGSLLGFIVRGPALYSAGASGAIFGVIGMNLAFFLINRDSLGEFGRQRMIMALIIIGYNLFAGFTTPGIDNLGHIGGLLGGFALGYGLAPQYRRVGYQIQDTVSLRNRWWVPLLAIIILSSGVTASLSFWAS